MCLIYGTVTRSVDSVAVEIALKMNFLMDATVCDMKIGFCISQLGTSVFKIEKGQR